MQKICKQCTTTFGITPKDENFYSRFSVPSPTLCPSCRRTRRLAWRNESTLYKRTCSGTGKTIIAIYPENTSFPVYDHEYFFSDKWNPLTYGRPYDFNRSFFDQFNDLLKVTPRIVNYSFANENAEYGNLASWNKDCYMCFEADNNRDCFYAYYSYRCVDVFDCNYAVECELCFNCVDIHKCYNIKHSQNCKNCADSEYLKTCQGCKNCFGCVNLINKQYYFLNEQLTEEKYKKTIKEKSPNFTQEDLEQLAQELPHKFMNGTQNENCTGDNLNNCQNCEDCFDSSNLRDCKFVHNSERIKDGYDIDTYGGIEGAELVYECHSVGRGSANVAFGNNVYQGLTNSYYCTDCANSKDIFGCASLNHAKNCILNKQYSEKEYQTLLPKIISHMRKTEEWGEFFPAEMSPFWKNKDS